MTTLYKPVKIESAEQAEALPRGTVATYGEKSAKLTAHHVGHVGTRGDVWLCIGEFMPNADMVGWTALVPIEAEEETRHGLVGLIVPDAPHDERRLVTPWEAV